MQFGIKTMLAAGLMIGTLGSGATPVSAMPRIDGSVANTPDPAPKAENIYYHCGYYGCHHYRHYGYRYYGYHYYRPRYYIRRYYRFY